MSSASPLFRIVFAVVFFAALALRYSQTGDVTDEALEPLIATETNIEGVVIREPVTTESGQRIVVRAGESRIAATIEMFPKLAYGDTVRLDGTLERPESFETDSGRIFAYDEYLKKDGVGYVMFYPSVEVLAHDGGNIIKRYLFVARRAFLDAVTHTVPQPYAALLAGVAVGAQDGLPERLEDDFRTVGLVHIVVLSGYNITIVAETVMRVLATAPRYVSLSAGAASVILFVIGAGASAATVRAGIMAILVIIARMTGRRYDMLRALVIAGAVMVIQNPRILLHDPSFQLSFLATLGLVYGAPFFERVFSWLPRRFGIQESAVSTMATQLFVLPLLMHQTGSVSLIALLANMLVLWSIPVAMLATFAGGLLGAFAPPLGAVPLFFAYGIARYVVFVTETFARIPFASISIPLLSWWAVAGMYAVLAWWVWKKRKPRPAFDGAGQDSSL